MVRKDTLNWIASAEYDLETAIHMIDSRRYLYVVFLCHLALEKMLKAHVTEVTQSVPAKSHDLVYLLKKSDLEVPESFLDFIGKINTARFLPGIQKIYKVQFVITLRKWLKITFVRQKKSFNG